MVNQHTELFRIDYFENIKTSVTSITVTRGPNIRMSFNFDRYLLKVGNHESNIRISESNISFMLGSG